MATETDDQSYYEKIQRFFTEVTGRSVLLSGRDLEFLERLHRRGVAPAAVCKGLRDAVEAMPDDDPPGDVFACRKWIAPYAEQAGERSVGGDSSRTNEAEGDAAAKEAPEEGARGEVSEAPELLRRALARVEEAGRRSSRESVRDVYREAWRELRRACEGEAADPYETLSSVEAGLVDGYFRALDRADQERLREEIAADDDELLDRMSPEARREHLRARRRRLLMREYDLISLLD